ncbi:DUF1851 domain-containing protein [Aeoliella sp. ICT_H6.2]|uniref:DUF1851 domain-containing protein n=1 Tax=Aeoliella straminimaris TaxID=2954799 RepID=A0A9X2JHU3_9BACT|nr:T6SS immunity protein Tdi1 domain-containing protein [Aeoliella straminimaris]MCO6044998.1 DUF1851 domain-containing protein [Aeoliella straminimaris]
MPITMNDLTISPDGVDMNAILSDWEWAMPEPLRPILITVMGDVFAQGTSGNVYFIDTVQGTIESVAEDGSSFQSLLSDTQFVTDHMFPSRIVQLRNAGVTLEPQTVYSHKQPLVLGGNDDIENIEATNVSVHVSIHGQIHRQVQDLPDGASIDSFTID